MCCVRDVRFPLKQQPLSPLFLCVFRFPVLLHIHTFLILEKSHPSLDPKNVCQSDLLFFGLDP